VQIINRLSPAREEFQSPSWIRWATAGWIALLPPPVYRRRGAARHLTDLPEGRGWLATGVFTSRSETGDGFLRHAHRHPATSGIPRRRLARWQGAGREAAPIDGAAR